MPEELTDDQVLLRFVGELFGHALARRRAESEKDKTQALFEAAIAQSPSGILIADAPDVTIRLANTAALGIRGGKVELLNGIDYVDHTQTWQTLRTDGTLYPAEELPLTRAVRSGDVTLGEEVIILDDAGQKHWVIVNAAPIRDSKGRITSGIVIQHDISARKRAESERVQIEEQYRQAQKMEAIGQLTGGVAHDFNNLLQVINGATSLALDDLDENHPAHELLTDVAAAGDRAARLVSQLLMFSRRQIMRLESLDLNEVVESLLKMVGRVIGEDIRLKWRPEPDLEPINADRGMIEQAMVNLCVNARDSMSKGGILNIETRNVTIDERFCAGHPWAIPGTYSCISVSDNGPGLDTNALAHIFEPFFTTKGVGKGTGLGLSTVYGIIKQHDGLIHVHSMPDEETIFSLYWPIHNADS
jgi:PAS domain S-box-containing protein